MEKINGSVLLNVWIIHAVTFQTTLCSWPQNLMARHNGHGIRSKEFSNLRSKPVNQRYAESLFSSVIKVSERGKPVGCAASSGLSESERRLNRGVDAFVKEIIHHCKRQDVKGGRFVESEYITAEEALEKVRECYGYGFGIPLSFICNSKWQASLERKDNNKGHSNENCVWIPLEFNTPKQWKEQMVQEMCESFTVAYPRLFEEMDQRRQVLLQEYIRTTETYNQTVANGEVAR